MDREYEFYLRRKESLLQEKRGKYVIVVGEEIVAEADNNKDALRIALKDHAPGTFLIQHCVPDEEETMRFHSRVFLPYV